LYLGCQRSRSSFLLGFRDEKSDRSTVEIRSVDRRGNSRFRCAASTFGAFGTHRGGVRVVRVARCRAAEPIGRGKSRADTKAANAARALAAYRLVESCFQFSAKAPESGNYSPASAILCEYRTTVHRRAYRSRASICLRVSFM